MGRLLRISALVLTGIAVGTVVTKFLSFDRIWSPRPIRTTDKDSQPKKVENVKEEAGGSDESDMFI